jgi:hypothetical protein
MLSIEECKKILNRNGKKLTEIEIEQIRDFLWEIAQIEVKNLEISDTNEDSSNNEQGEQ